MGTEDIDSRPDRHFEDFLLPGPLTVDGESVLGEIERGVVEGRLPFDADDVHLLACAVQTIADYGQLLSAAAAGDRDALAALRRRLEGPPGAQLSRDLAVFTDRRLIGRRPRGPCPVSPVDLGSLVGVGLHLGGGVLDPTWARKGFAEYVALAAPVDQVLSAGREWIDTGRPDELREGFAALRNIGTAWPPPREVRCFTEQERCLNEFLVFPWMALTAPSKIFWPGKMVSLLPADHCAGSESAITVFSDPSTLPAFPGSALFPASAADTSFFPRSTASAPT
jgi:hypothetical protein